MNEWEQQNEVGIGDLDIGDLDCVRRNKLLLRQDPSWLRGLLAEMEQVQLPPGSLLFKAFQPIEHVYFPLDGAASIIATASRGRQCEVALFGREGFIVPAAALGADRIPHRCEVQMPLKALRLAMPFLREGMDRNREFRQDLLAFAQVVTVQITCTTLASAIDRIPQRLARWLLMYHDRSDSDDLALSHGTLSKMLSVRRSSVTDALHVLEGMHMIQAERGLIQICDRLALTRFTGGAYGMPEGAYEHLITEREVPAWASDGCGGAVPRAAADHSLRSACYPSS